MLEAEEFGNLEELGPLDEDQQILESLMEQECILYTRKTLLSSPTPTILMDRGLHLQWVNRPFEDRFGSLGEVLGIHLIQLFHDDFDDDDKKRDLYLGLRSHQNGYSLYGRLQKRGKERLNIITNLLILPLFNTLSDQEMPIAYQGIFDDISTEYRSMLKNTYHSLLEAARLKDNDTGNHIKRVNRYSRCITESLLNRPDFPEVDQEYVVNISYLASMHDVGKIGTPDDILNKAGALAPWEWEIMKEHTINGAYIMGNYPDPMAKEIALRHHECWDGTGYPHGLSGCLIPLCGRIVTIADVYDALRMQRSYKEALSHGSAKKIYKTLPD